MLDDFNQLKGALLSKFDQMIPSYLAAETTFYNNMLLNYDEPKNSYSSVDSTSPFLNTLEGALVKILLRLLTDTLLSVLNPSQVFLKDFKEQIKMSTLMSHAKCRKTLVTLVDSHVEQLGEGTISYNATHKEQLLNLTSDINTLPLPSLAFIQESKPIMESIENVMTLFTDTLPLEVRSASESAGSLITDMIETTNNFFKSTFDEVLEDLSAINGTLFTSLYENITSRVSSLDLGIRTLSSDLASVMPNMKI